MNEVDKYIAKFPKEVQEILQNVRATIVNAAPDVVEKMAYGMPGYKLNGKPFVYFAGYAKHVGFYATPVAHEAFADELNGYKQGKGSVQFPLNKPMPFDLIKRLIEFKMKQLSLN